METDVVLNFIHKRFPKDCNWLDGNCYYFAVILKTRFPFGKILYDTLSGHFVTAIDGVNYDWSGIVPKAGVHNYIVWDKFDEYDPYQKERIEIGCIK